jgi:protein-S-isoprenylcysteine O-methyltransferase Ste14
MKLASLLGFAAMVAALVGLLWLGAAFARSAWTTAIQIAAVILMIWARITFGGRSFHAAATPTHGGLVTTGPYRHLRHPIYAAIVFFAWAGVIDHLSAATFSLGVFATAGAIARMLCEEHFLLRRYPEYREYMKRTKRLIPGLW